MAHFSAGYKNIQQKGDFLAVRIQLDQVSLDYFYYLNRKSLKKTILQSAGKLFGRGAEPLPSRRALEGISALIQPGDRVALMGKNGSGKSTLLRILSGIYRPSAGSLEIEGKVVCLLDIGIGLNLEATGYENIVLMGILQGKTKKEMRAKFEEIEEFTELKDYLNMAVRTYSSGMRLRLAFAIATSIESDILILDEVIGVGDQPFMEKAQLRLKNLIHACQILVLASHSTEILQRFCNKSMILKEGKCVFFGGLEEGIALYEQGV